MWQGIEYSLSLKQQRQHLPFLLYLSFLYVLHDPTPLLIPPGDVEGHDEHPGEGGEEEELEQDGHGGAAQRGPYTRKIHSQ